MRRIMERKGGSNHGKKSRISKQPVEDGGGTPIIMLMKTEVPERKGGKSRYG